MEHEKKDYVCDILPSCSFAGNKFVRIFTSLQKEENCNYSIPGQISLFMKIKSGSIFLTIYFGNFSFSLYKLHKLSYSFRKEICYFVVNNHDVIEWS